MTSINTNVGALNARASAVRATTKMEQAMERLSSGAACEQCRRRRRRTRGGWKNGIPTSRYQHVIRNAQDGVGLIQTAESGVNEIRNMVLRMRELAVQMANGIYEDTPDRNNAQLEVTALINQVTLIAENTVSTTLLFSMELLPQSTFRLVIQLQKRLNLVSLIWLPLGYQLTVLTLQLNPARRLHSVRSTLHWKQLQVNRRQWVRSSTD